jgi:hypothetical protein
MAKYKQGLFVPKNPAKYKGDVNNIHYRSSWELAMHDFLDNNIQVIAWNSECIPIPYIKPTDGRVHRYYPDYYVEYYDADNKLSKEIIEVKPDKQTKKSRARTTKSRLYENLTYAINVAKWDACMQFCKRQGLTFRILTEKELFR